MREVSGEFKNAFLNGRQKYLTLNFSDGTTLGSESISSESMKIDQLLCSEQQVAFGLANASVFTISIFNGQISHKDLWVSPVITANDGESSMSLGHYKVEQDVVADDRNTRTLTCYDALYYVVNNDYSDWYMALKMPMTLKQFRDNFFTEIGITQVDVELPNDGMTIDKTIETTSLSGSAVLKAILEPNAAFGFIDYDGNFKYVLWEHGTGLFPAPDLYPSEDLYPIGISAAVFGTSEESELVLGSLVYADYNVNEITGVKIQTDSSDVGVMIGKGDNVYSIMGNFLLFGKGSAELQAVGKNFLEYADQLFFRPCKFKVRCHPWIEPGDLVAVNTKAFRVVVPVLQRTISGITALYDDYQAQGSEIYMAQANNLSTMVENLKYKSLEIVQSVDDLHSTMIEEDKALDEKFTSEIKQLPHTIELSVSKDALSATKSASIKLSVKDEDGEEISSSDGTITLSGDVVFKSNLTDGTTTISGSNIKTGTIDANVVNVENVIAASVAAENITGSTISGKNISGCNIYVSDNKYGFVIGNDEKFILIHPSARSNVPYVDGNSTLYFKNIPYYMSSEGGTSWEFLTGLDLVSGGRIANMIPSTSGFMTKTNPHINSMGNATSSTPNIRVSGTASGDIRYITGSSKRWKHDITTDISEELDPHKLYDVDVVQFVFNDDYMSEEDVRRDKEVIGFIAEDMQEKYPIAADVDKEGRASDWNYRFIVPAMLKLIQEQKMQIDDLEKKNAELEERIARLEALIGG